MKQITITKNTAIPGEPGFKKGGQHRVSDRLADLLVRRGCAVYDKCKPREEVKAKKEGKEVKSKAKKSDVEVTRMKGTKKLNS